MALRIKPGTKPGTINPNAVTITRHDALKPLFTKSDGSNKNPITAETDAEFFARQGGTR